MENTDTIKTYPDDLTALGMKYGTDKAFWHRYTSEYHRYFSPIRDTVKNYLEIGVWKGASLRMFRDYFPNATITGVDLYVDNPKFGDRIDYVYGDQSNREGLAKLVEVLEEKPFDIILDDGSHKSDHQMLSFAMLWPLLKSGGIYVLENLHTSQNDATPKGAYKSIMDWTKTKTFSSGHLTDEECAQLTSEIANIEVWHRPDSVIPYRCWKCWTDYKEEKQQCRCVCKDHGGCESITSFILKN